MLRTNACYVLVVKVPELSPFGRVLRHWRRLRGVSQLALAAEAGVSSRHLSFVETGRSRPGRDLIFRLVDALDVPPRERNDLFVSAGFRPLYQERRLSEQVMSPYLEMVQRILDNHEPFPGFAYDRWWNVVLVNNGASTMIPAFSSRDANVIEIFLANAPPHIVNRAEVGGILIQRLRQDCMKFGPDDRLEAFVQRIESEIGRPGSGATYAEKATPVVSTQIDLGSTVASTVSTIVRFDTAREIQLAELRIELVFPADSETEALVRRTVKQ